MPKPCCAVLPYTHISRLVPIRSRACPGLSYRHNAADCTSPTIAYYGNGTRFDNGTYFPPASTGSVSFT